MLSNDIVTTYRTNNITISFFSKKKLENGNEIHNQEDSSDSSILNEDVTTNTQQINNVLANPTDQILDRYNEDLFLRAFRNHNRQNPNNETGFIGQHNNDSQILNNNTYEEAKNQQLPSNFIKQTQIDLQQNINTNQNPFLNISCEESIYNQEQIQNNIIDAINRFQTDALHRIENIHTRAEFYANTNASTMSLININNTNTQNLLRRMEILQNQLNITNNTNSLTNFFNILTPSTSIIMLLSAIFFAFIFSFYNKYFNRPILNSLRSDIINLINNSNNQTTENLRLLINQAIAERFNINHNNNNTISYLTTFLLGSLTTLLIRFYKK